MSIIGPLPNNIVNGDPIDAVPVMANFNWIVSQVNANVPIISQTPLAAWTPSVTFGGGSTGLTTAFKIGSYYTVGAMVVVAFDILLTAKGSSTGALQIGNLPITVNASWVSGGLAFQGIFTASVTFAGRSLFATAVPSSTHLSVFEVVSGGTSVVVDDTFCSNSSEFSGTFMYPM